MTVRLPEIQQRLNALAEELLMLSDEISRRRPFRRGENTSTPMTPELRHKIRVMAKENPDWPQHKIGMHFGVKSARVSEALRGKRT